MVYVFFAVMAQPLFTFLHLTHYNLIKGQEDAKFINHFYDHDDPCCSGACLLSCDSVF